MTEGASVSEMIENTLYRKLWTDHTTNTTWHGLYEKDGEYN